jgi:dTDP-4-dehydrorhamnose reductase
MFHMQSPLPESLPERIDSEQMLDELLSRPRPELIEAIPRIKSPLLLLGAAGKMGPSLALLAQRAAAAAGHDLKIVAASRFSDENSKSWFQQKGIQTVHCDLLDRGQVQRLPDAETVIYLTGLKFGTSSNPELTWAVNTLAPAHTAERYPRARFAILSTGNVYPLVPVNGGGSTEADLLTPAGEYPNAAIARERIFQYYSGRNNTPMALIRLNYALDLRYGVLVDIAQKVFSGAPIDLTTGYVNCIWQGDANEFILRLLDEAAAPPAIFNLTAPAILSIRELALQFADLFQTEARFTGTEAPTALLNNPVRLCKKFGEPPTPIHSIIRWTAHWIRSGGKLLDKPTHFETRNGQY